LSNASAWRVLFEVSSLTLAGSLLLRLALMVDFTPTWLAPTVWLSLPLLPLLRQRLPLAPHGYDVRSWRRASTRLLLVALGILGVFTAGVGGWRWLTETHPVLDGNALSFEIILLQLVWVAVPEELFFRGYIQQRLYDCISQRGARQHTVAVLLGAVLFALAHIMVAPGWRRAAVFFPGCIMGWLRIYSQGLLASTLFHWLANLLALVLHL
jgi:membrane protease YdiL (CAAX protease family)